jgi:hypothetical protein
MPERQDHAAEADALRRSRRGGDQQIGRGHRHRRLQMMLKKPDLIDADTFCELDFFELAPEHFRMFRILARGRGRPDSESHPPTLSVSSDGVLRAAETRPLRRGRSEGELRTLRAIRLRRRDQQESMHIPTGRSASSTDALARKS